MKDKEWDKEIDAKLWASLMDSHKSSPVLYSFIASVLASIGLATNSQTTILGSMLLSPIGSLINKNNVASLLTKRGYNVNKSYSHWIRPLIVVILIAIGVSYLFGLIFSKLVDPFTGEKVSKNWPTEEMKSRADPINAFYMIFIALVCGVALPMTILSNSSVKFVAIGIASALIPPLANIGISLSQNDSDYRSKSIKTGISIFLINVLLLWLPSKYLFNSFVQNKNNFKIIEQIANSWDLTGISKSQKGISKPSDGERFTGCRAGELKKK
tara:strand:+ start:2493 stop:3302 length:810 start_codon:yes stop_codon:yes gene_type:complete